MKRPFILMVDSANEEEPDPRRFGSLEKALQAYKELDRQWKHFAWIVEVHEHRAPRIHMRDGVRASGQL